MIPEMLSGFPAAAAASEPVVTLPSPWRLDSNAIPYPRGWNPPPQGAAPGQSPSIPSRATIQWGIMSHILDTKNRHVD